MRVLLLVVFTAACATHRNVAAVTSTTCDARVRTEVAAYMQLVANRVSHDGPSAWRGLFAPSDLFVAQQAFLMSSSERPEANPTAFNLPIASLTLRWDDLRIDPLTCELAAVGAKYHEEVSSTTGRKGGEDGVFTAVAQHRDGRWWLRDAHWSVSMNWIEPGAI